MLGRTGTCRQLPVSCLFITFLVLNIYVSTVPISDLHLVQKQFPTMSGKDSDLEFSMAGTA